MSETKGSQVYTSELRRMVVVGPIFFIVACAFLGVFLAYSVDEREIATGLSKSGEVVAACVAAADALTDEVLTSISGDPASTYTRTDTFVRVWENEYNGAAPDDEIRDINVIRASLTAARAVSGSAAVAYYADALQQLITMSLYALIESERSIISAVHNFATVQESLDYSLVAMSLNEMIWFYPNDNHILPEAIHFCGASAAFARFQETMSVEMRGYATEQPDCSRTLASIRATNVVGRNWSPLHTWIANTSATARQLLRHAVVDAAVTVDHDPSGRTATRQALFTAGLALAFVGLLASIGITFWFNDASSHARALLDDFTMDNVAVIAIYRKALQSFNFSALSRQPIHPSSAVETSFMNLINFFRTLRPFIPQQLFGELNTTHTQLTDTSHKDGGWALEREGVRLELSQAFASVVVLGIQVNYDPTVCKDASKQYDKDGQRLPYKQTAFSQIKNSFMALVEHCVNCRGGIVYSFTGNLVVCVWNVTNTVANPADCAIEAAESIKRGMMQAVTDDEISDEFYTESGDCVVDEALGYLKATGIGISKSQCLFSNSKTFQRKHVSLLGSAVADVRKLARLNSFVFRDGICVDQAVQHEMDKGRKLCCRPVMMLKGPLDTSTTIFTVSPKPMGRDQWKDYQAVFTLVRNRMKAEALREIDRYLTTYGKDQIAEAVMDMESANEASSSSMR